MEKTKESIKREEEKLKERKRKKYDTLEQPPAKKSRGEPTKDKGHSGNGKEGSKKTTHSYCKDCNHTPRNRGHTPRDPTPGEDNDSGETFGLLFL